MESYATEGKKIVLIMTNRFVQRHIRLQCFDTVGWVATEHWGADVVICLERGADLHYGPADAIATHCLLLQ